jgi:hypothetical protein
MAIIDKVWNISWDMWEHRNHIKHNTMHPRKLAALENIKEQLQNIYNTGPGELLARDHRLFAKPIETLLKKDAIEMEQWITTVWVARRRAASVKEDHAASLRAERALMRRWLNQDATGE